MKRIPILCLLLLLPMPVAAQDSPFVAQTSPYTLSGDATGGAKLTFWLSVKSDTISGVTVRPVETVGPLGSVLPPHSVGKWPLKGLGTLSTVPIRVVLPFLPEQFDRPGDYTVRLAFEVKEQPTQRGSVTLTVKRLAADINLEEMSNVTYPLVRSSPWGEASGTGDLDLRETSGGAAACLQMAVNAVYREGSKKQVPGSRVSVRPPVLRTLPPGGQRKIGLLFQGIRETGSFTTSVTLTSPSFSSSQSRTIPLKVQVTDRWGWAFLVIVLGVLGGFIVHTIAQSWRPRRVNAYNFARIRGEIEHYLKAASPGETEEKLRGLLRRLRDLEDQNAFGDAAALAAKLAPIEQELDEYRKQIATEKTALRTLAESLRSQVDHFRREEPQPTDSETAFLRESDARFQEIETLLLADRVETAKATLETLQKEWEDLRKNRMNQALDFLQEDRLTSQEQKRILHCRYLVNQGKFDEAQAEMVALRWDIEKPSRASTVKDFRHLSLGVVAGEEQAAIVLADPAVTPTTNSPVAFEIRDPAGQLKGAELLWHFGEGGEAEKPGLKAFHPYRQPGDYRVTVEAVRNGQVVMHLATTVTVAAGKAERQIADIGRQIQWADVTLSLIALFLACLTGLLYLYVDKPFGSLAEYIGAFLWGFGIDNSVRGFAAVMKRITTAA